MAGFKGQVLWKSVVIGVSCSEGPAWHNRDDNKYKATLKTTGYVPCVLLSVPLALHWPYTLMPEAL